MEGRVLLSFVFFVALFILNSVIVWVLVKFLLLFMKIPKTLIKLFGYFCIGSALLITNNNSHCLCQHNCSSYAQNFTPLPLFTSHRNNNTIHFNLSYSHIKICWVENCFTMWGRQRLKLTNYTTASKGY